jgi:superfamily II DNA helicase RecQ
MSDADREYVWSRILDNDDIPAIFFLAPESLEKFEPRLLELNRMQRLARFAIDEVHCVENARPISLPARHIYWLPSQTQWGHDFRPSYLAVKSIKTRFQNVQITAFTATLPQTGARSLLSLLSLSAHSTAYFTASLNRSNLFYATYLLPPARLCSPNDAYAVLADFIIEKHPYQSGIIYCRRKKDTERLATFLRDQYGVRAGYYHAGISGEARTEMHAAWMSGFVNVIVATVRFAYLPADLANLDAQSG